MTKPLGRAWITAALMLVAACSLRGPSLAGYPGLATKVTHFYEDWGSEEGGSCLRPEMRIARTEVIEDSEERLILRIRYAYRDPAFQNERRPRIIRNCEGFATREFTIRKNDGRLDVVDMTGPRRQQRDFSS